jgi:translation initiation factor IF-3
MDYGKYRYNQQKREKEAKKKQKIIQVKEIRLSTFIEKHDLEVKASNAIRFLKEGDKLKVTLRFKGRERGRTEKGFEVMERFAELITEYGNPEKKPSFEGRSLTMIVSPVPPKKKPAGEEKPTQAEGATSPGESQPTQAEGATSPGESQLAQAEGATSPGESQLAQVAQAVEQVPQPAQSAEQTSQPAPVAEQTSQPTPAAEQAPQTEEKKEPGPDQGGTVKAENAEAVAKPSAAAEQEEA